MTPKLPHSARTGALWELGKTQHGVVARQQLLKLGYGPDAIKHALAAGRLHTLAHQGVYAIGRPQLTGAGCWMAAVLACGPGAALSHYTAALHLGMLRGDHRPIEVSVPISRDPRRPGIVVHRRTALSSADVFIHDRIPVTSASRTLIDIAVHIGPDRLEAAVNVADKLDLIDPDSLRVAIDRHHGRRGVAILRRLLDRQTFALTDSHLERRFLAITHSLSLPVPQTGLYVNGFRVDFFWPQLGLVIETDGLRYHRTAAQQARDRLRDQTHIAAGFTSLRFTHAQVTFQPAYVRSTLRRVCRRLATAA